MKGGISGFLLEADGAASTAGGAQSEAPSGDCGLCLFALSAPQPSSHTGLLAPGAGLGQFLFSLLHSHSLEQWFPSPHFTPWGHLGFPQ